jgi:hypothetical protein
VISPGPTFCVFENRKPRFTISNDGTLNNHGTIEGYNILYGIIDYGSFNNGGTFNNFGVLNSYRTFTNKPRGTLNNFSTLNNYGTLVNWISRADIGTINNDGILNNEGGIENWGVINNDCDGVITGGGTISGNPVVNVCFIAATIDIDPNTLNLKSRGRWITAYIELPATYDPSAIDVSTVTLNDVVPAEESPTEVGDSDGDGVPDLVVKFDRESVQGILSPGDEVFVSVAGVLQGGASFGGTDTIRVIEGVRNKYRYIRVRTPSG